jgi:hypothetical protein
MNENENELPPILIYIPGWPVVIKFVLLHRVVLLHGQLFFFSPINSYSQWDKPPGQWWFRIKSTV